MEPLELVRSVLRHDYWSVQEQLLTSVFRPGSRTAIKACHASSKTFTAADIVVIALMLGGDVLTTAPTGDQVRGQLWQQIRRVVALIPECYDWTVNTTEIYARGAFAVGRSTDQGVRLQGYHARPGSFLLIIADEAPGVIAQIYDAIGGMSAGGDVRLLLLGNPVEPSGPFFDIFDKGLSSWERLTIDAFDTPNLAGLSLEDLLQLDEHELDENVRPYLVTRRWVRERFDEWGEDHPSWQARVRGEFPDYADTSLFSRRWLQQAAERDHRADPSTTLTAGVDVAGPGDDLTTCLVRRGTDVLDVRGWSQQDPRAEVVMHLSRLVSSGLTQVNVDSIGIGWYFYLDLEAALAPLGVSVRAINVGLPSKTLNAAGQKTYKNLKAELYWYLREQFRDGDVCGLRHETTRRQLGWLRYTTERGLIVVESKDDLSKRGLPSPDFAEAAVLAWAPDTVASADDPYAQEAEMTVSLR